MDTDGDAEHPASRPWTDLSCVDRADRDERFEVEVVSDHEPSILIESRRATTATRVALFLADELGVRVFHPASSEDPVPRAVLVRECGADFDVDAAFDRTRRSRWRRATRQDPYPSTSS